MTPAIANITHVGAVISITNLCKFNLLIFCFLSALSIPSQGAKLKAFSISRIISGQYSLFFLHGLLSLFSLTST